jgi:hypothetical protein
MYSAPGSYARDVTSNFELKMPADRQRIRAIASMSNLKRMTTASLTGSI